MGFNRVLMFGSPLMRPHTPCNSGKVCNSKMESVNPEMAMKNRPI